MNGKSNIPGPDVSLATIIDTFTEEKSRSKIGEKWGIPLRPSSAGKCARALAYELTEFRDLAKYEPEEIDAKTTRIFSLGHDMERNLFYHAREAFKQSGDLIKLKYQQQIMSFFKLPLTGEMIQGSIDGAFEHKSWLAVVDAKSKKDGWSNHYKSRWEEHDEGLLRSEWVKPIDAKGVYIENLEAFLSDYRVKDPFFCDNIYQLNFYYWSECGFLRHRGSEFCSLLYYNKNDCSIKEVRFKPCEKSAEYVKQKFLAVHQAVDGDKNPELVGREYTLGSARCAFCRFSKSCWGKEQAVVRKDYFKTLPFKKWPKRLKEVPYQADLQELFTEYLAATTSSEKMDILEPKIIHLLNEAKCNKVELPTGEVFEVKHLKSGGIRNGPRQVLRRSKK